MCHLKRTIDPYVPQKRRTNRNLTFALNDPLCNIDSLWAALVLGADPEILAGGRYYYVFLTILTYFRQIMLETSAFLYIIFDSGGRAGPNLGVGGPWAQPYVGAPGTQDHNRKL